MSREIRVAVLDDERIVCDRLGPALEKQGYTVETFTESRAALGRFAEVHFDVLVTDLKMKGVGGMDVLSFVRERSPDTRVIVITGFATVETAKEAMRRGAVDFVAKPFRMRDLVHLVGEVVARDSLEDH